MCCEAPLRLCVLTFEKLFDDFRYEIFQNFFKVNLSIHFIVRFTHGHKFLNFKNILVLISL